MAGASTCAQRVKCSLIALALTAKLRSQPRTVEAIRPRAAAILRWPWPRALATRAVPMTSTPSRRRNRVSSGTSTCVTAQARQIERRGRRARTARPGAPHARAPWPQGRRPASQLGQQIRPPTRSASTAASSIPTMSTAGLRLRQESPFATRAKGFGEGALARSGRAHADAHPPSRQTQPYYFVLSKEGVARPVTNTCSRSMTATGLTVINQRDAQHPEGSPITFNDRVPKGRRRYVTDRRAQL